MRYTLKNGFLQCVRSVSQNGMTTANPSDELVDQLHAGFPLITTLPPEYDAETQELNHGYVQESDGIRETWTLVQKNKETQTTSEEN